MEHNCLDLINYQTKVRLDLQELPLEEGEILFIDGSSRVVQGRRCNGYAVVEGTDGNVEEMGKVPSNWSAQTCELYALSQALKLLKGKQGTVYTDSRYAYGVAHPFGKIREERGLVNSKGKELVPEELIRFWKICYYQKRLLWCM